MNDINVRNAKRFLSAMQLPTNGLSDEAILAKAYAEGYPKPEPAAEPAPVPTPEPAPVPEFIVPEPEPAPAPKVDAITSAITAAITAAMAQQQFLPATIDEAKIIELIRLHATQTLTVNNPDKKTTKTIKGAHRQLKDVITTLNSGYNPYLVGGAGTGKTTLAKQAAEALDLNFYFTGAIFSKHELLGFVDAKGDYQRTPFYTAYTEGGLFLWDEIDASAEETLPAFNAAIENKICAFPNGIKEMHPDFKCVAAANTVGTGATIQFNGRNPQDGATLDRYFMIEIAIDPQLETNLTIAHWVNNGGCPDNTYPATSWLETVRNARAIATKQHLNVIISPRSSYVGAGLLASGMSREQVIYGTFGNSLTASQLKELGV